jgi:heme exporter protein C
MTHLRSFTWEYAVGLLGLFLITYGQYQALCVVPPEQMMGEVARILYVHVPAAWLALLTFTIAFVAALGFLFTGRMGWDWLVEAACEVGVLMTALLLLLGSIFARPTWGVFWTWDPRLTSSAVMLLTFVGVLLLRSLLSSPEKRATYTSVATILAFINIPVTYLSVKWWRTLHQIQSSPETLSDMYTFVLRINALAFLCITVYFLAQRWRLSARRALEDQPPPLIPEVSS